MKTFRLWLLVLLAVLLPIRGAVAAAMLCPPMMPAGHSQTVFAADHAPAAEPMTADGFDHEHMQHHHAESDQLSSSGDHGDPKSSGTADACNLCAAYCSVTPILSTWPTVELQPQVSTVTFPVLAAPAASFVSGGQDRPPRTI